MKRSQMLLATMCAGVLTQTWAANANRSSSVAVGAVGRNKATYAELLHNASNFQLPAKSPLLPAQDNHHARAVLADWWDDGGGPPPDTSRPSTYIENPESNASIPVWEFNPNGSVQEDVEIVDIQVKLFRWAGGGQYWDGSKWTANETWISAYTTDVFSTNANWNFPNRPNDEQMTPGRYTFSARARDGIGFGSTASADFTIRDISEPGVTLTAPAENSSVTPAELAASGVSGTATDNVGVNSLTAELTRTNGTVTEYWTGTTWSADRTSVTATLANPGATSTAWSIDGFDAKDLIGGQYYLSLTVNDAAGNEGYSYPVFNVLGPDVTEPSVTLASPADGSTITVAALTATGIIGTATDNVGVEKVDVYLQRPTVANTPHSGGIWNGTSWDYGRFPVASATVEHQGATTTSWKLDGPTTGILNGTYSLRVVVSDAAGNTTGSESSFTVEGADETAPAVTLTTPTPNSTVSAAQLVASGLGGNVTDNLAVSGVKVRFVRRTGAHETEIWNGTSWVESNDPDTFFLDATVTNPGAANTSWKFSGLESLGIQQEDRQYFVAVAASDPTGNVSTQYYTFSVGTPPPDTQNPTVSVAAPTASVVLNTEILANGIHGIANDNTGVQSITGRLIRYKTYANPQVTEVWDGAAWQTETDPGTLSTPITVDGQGEDVTWRVTNLPTKAELDVNYDYYSISVTAQDSAGNTESATQAFQILPSTPVTTIDSPGEGEYVPTANLSITGTATDDTEVLKTEVEFARVNQEVAEYWNGTAWQADEFWLTANLTPGGPGESGTWNLDPALLPQGEDRTEGSYFVVARSLDADDYGYSVSTHFNLGLQDLRPEVELVTPDPSSDNVFNENAFPTITATATDEREVVSAEVSLVRVSGRHLEYWNGTAWVLDQTWLPMQIGTSGPGVATKLEWTEKTPPPGSLSYYVDYGIRVRAYDATGPSGEARGSFSIADSTAPSLTIQTPADGSEVSASQIISSGIHGTAADNFALGPVTATLHRLGAGGQNEYWNGAQWTADDGIPYIVSTRLTDLTHATWELIGQPFSRADWGNGLTYVLSVTVSDFSNNSTTKTSQFVVTQKDTTAPTATITSPASSAVLKPAAFAASLVNGSASDDYGVASVKLRLIRNDRGTLTYWNGTNFVATPTDAATTVTDLGPIGPDIFGADWKLNRLPSAAQLTSARYTVQVTPVDTAGNIGNPVEQTVTVTTDARRPVATIATPTANQKVTMTDFAQAGAVTGTATDDNALWGVHVYLSRVRGGATQYWSGSAWSSTKTGVDAAVTGANWTWINNVPSAADLDGGAYRLEVAGYDVVGDGSFATRAFTLIGESNAPHITITSPGASAKLQADVFAASSVNGSVTDDTEIDSIKVRLYRVISGVKTYWSGYDWSNVSTFVPAIGDSVDPHSATWSIETLPDEASLSAGAYTVQVVATDIYGNSSTSTRPFSIVGESVKPVVKIASPTPTVKIDASKLTSSSFKGTATDNSQVTAVAAKLYRTRNGVKEYYNGTGWSTTSVTAPVVATGLNTANASWQLKPLPAKTLFDTGVYGLYVQATDASGNVGSSSVTFNVFADNTKPVATITAPSSNGTVQASAFDASTVRGTATDNEKVSEIRLKLTRTRNSTKEYWTGTAWSTTATNAQINSTGLNTASATWALAPAPTLSDLTGGTYSISVTPVDPSGNVGTPVTRNFTVVVPVTALRYNGPSGKSF